MHARNTYIRIIFLTITMFLCVLSWGQNPKGGRVTATADPTIICAGESSQLHAEAVVQTIIDFETGNLSQLSQYSFTNDPTYPWTVVTADNGSSYCIQSGNGGHHSTVSTFSISKSFVSSGMIRFDAHCMGEGSYTVWDKCIFKIGNQIMFSNGATSTGWTDYTFYVEPGTYTFTWIYDKDSTTHPTGDYFRVDNIAISEIDGLHLYGFENGMQDWTTIDADGHGNAWSRSNNSAHSGSYCMKASYNSSYAHNDYLVSPRIKFGGKLVFYAKRYGTGYNDFFRVYVSTTGNNSAAYFTTQLTNGDVAAPSTYTRYEYDLSNFQGQGYVAIVYTAPADQWYLYIDDITIIEDDPNSGGSSSEATFLWQPGNMSGSDPTVSPTQTTTYTVTASNEQGVIGTAQVTVIVDPLPELSIEPENPSICLEDTITLYARVNVPDCPRPGDILCNNGSVVHPDEWTTSMGAQGVVFYVDDTGQHGWAIDLGQIQQNGKIKWSTESKTISGLQPYSNWTEAIVDIDGYTNTQIIRDFGDASKYPAAWAVNFNQGWYLPAIGQLNFLFSELVAVNASLEQVAGQNAKIIIKDTKEIWSSTACSDNKYVMRLWTRLGRLGFDKKTNTNYVRSVKNF